MANELDFDTLKKLYEKGAVSEEVYNKYAEKEAKDLELATAPPAPSLKDYEKPNPVLGPLDPYVSPAEPVYGPGWQMPKNKDAPGGLRAYEEAPAVFEAKKGVASVADKEADAVAKDTSASARVPAPFLNAGFPSDATMQAPIQAPIQANAPMAHGQVSPSVPMSEPMFPGQSVGNPALGIPANMASANKYITPLQAAQHNLDQRTLQEEQAIAEREGQFSKIHKRNEADIINRTVASEEESRSIEMDKKAENDAYLADMQKKYDDGLDAVLNSKIDPEHYWSSRSTGQKIALTIGMALGAIGTNIKGQSVPNYTANMVQGAIDNDIKAQEENLRNKAGAIHELGGSIAIRKRQGLDDAEAARAARADAWLFAGKQLDSYDSALLPQKQALELDRMRKAFALRHDQAQLDFLNLAAANKTALNKASSGGDAANIKIYKDTSSKVNETLLKNAEAHAAKPDEVKLLDPNVVLANALAVAGFKDPKTGKVFAGVPGENVQGELSAGPVLKRASEKEQSYLDDINHQIELVNEALKMKANAKISPSETARGEALRANMLAGQSRVDTKGGSRPPSPNDLALSETRYPHDLNAYDPRGVDLARLMQSKKALEQERAQVLAGAKFAAGNEPAPKPLPLVQAPGSRK